MLVLFQFAIQFSFKVSVALYYGRVLLLEVHTILALIGSNDTILIQCLLKGKSVDRIDSQSEVDCQASKPNSTSKN
jgi:hypothetical protein